MAQALHSGQVTPADELRDLLAMAETRVANVRGSGDGAVTLLKDLDRIAELWPLLEAQGVDLRSEAGRWKTLQASVERRAGPIVAELRKQGGIQVLRKRVHPAGTGAPWWRLDEIVVKNRRAQLRRSAIVTAIILVVAFGLYFILNSLVDPNVKESSRRITAGEQAVQQHGDWSAALVEFQAAAVATPNDYDAWIRVGIADEQLQNEVAAQDAFGRARALLPSELEFLKARASGYFTFSMFDPAGQDLQAALAIKNDDAQAWYMAASVYESRDQISKAIDALTKASSYAEETNQDELVALSRYRMGMLMQRQSLPQDVETPTPTP